MKPINQWKCCECDEIYYLEYEAEACCNAEVAEVYVCPICDKEYAYEDDALECLGGDTVAQPVIVSAEELEAAGQMRLI